MPVEARELIDSRKSLREAPNRRSTERVFQADITQDLAVIPGNVTNLPEIGDKLPWDTTQEVYTLSAVYEHGSVNTSRITVYYSNDPPTWGGNIPGDTTFMGWNQSYYRIAQPIPYAIEDTRSHRWVHPDGTTRSITTYPVAHSSSWEARKKFIRNVRVAGVNSSMWETIGDLSNKLVKVYNRWYQFTLGDVIQRAQNVWDTTYTFDFDPGTPNVYDGQTGSVFYPANLSDVQGLYPGLFWCRPPYHIVTLIPGYANGLPDWPTWVATPQYEVAQTGHLSLPGIGPL